jgi:hypothetical protein
MMIRLRKETSDGTMTRVLCLFTAVLVGCTWRLWSGQQVFPQVPLVAAAVHLPRWIDGLSGIVLLSSLLGGAALASRPAARRSSLSVALLCLLTLWLTDQHRLQPWAYHFALAAWILAFFPAPNRLPWLRLLMVSVYVYSALSKFDARFLQTHGVLFLEAAVQLTGRQVDPAMRESLAHGALLLPLGELGTGVLLAVRGLRPLGLVAAAVLHLTLITLLGPWGLDHRWGVLVWNVSFLTQVLLLFRPAGHRASTAGPLTQRWWQSDDRASRIALVPILLALLLPLAEPLGLWDSWLSWGLYSTRAEKVEIYIAQDAVRHLPAPVRPYCDRADAVWVRLAMDRWSLETLQAPIYPHPRFELGVGLAVIECLPPTERRVMVVERSSPNRRTGLATSRHWDGDVQLGQLADRYRWNSQPRRPSCPEGTPRLPAAAPRPSVLPVSRPAR